MYDHGMRRHCDGKGFGSGEGGGRCAGSHGMGHGPGEGGGRCAGPHGMGHGPGAGGRGTLEHGRGRRHHLVPTLLILLRKGPQHGYALLGQLQETLPQAGAMPDVSSVYRALADLEQDGAVVSRWEAGDGGGRRVYELTPAGEEMLKSWVPQLEEEHLRLGHLIDRYRS